jgi:hypothetical protein
MSGRVRNCLTLEQVPLGNAICDPASLRKLTGDSVMRHMSTPSRNVPFRTRPCEVHVNLLVPVKRRRALVAINPIKPELIEAMGAPPRRRSLKMVFPHWTIDSAMPPKTLTRG